MGNAKLMLKKEKDLKQAASYKDFIHHHLVQR